MARRSAAPADVSPAPRSAARGARKARAGAIVDPAAPGAEPVTHVVPDLVPLLRPITVFAELPGNPRRGDADAVGRSLARFRQRKPIVARVDGTVIAGNHTLQAARALGWPSLAAVFVDDDDDTARAYALADNRTAELGGYDEQALVDMIAAVEAADAELLAATGWSSDDLVDLVKQLERDAGGRPDVDAVPPRPARARTVPGDVWILGAHRLVCGSATEPTVMDKLLGGSSVRLVWTDPPYNVAVEGAAGTIQNDDLPADEFRDLIVGAMTSAAAALEPGGPIYVAHSETERLVFTEAFLGAGLKLQATLVWAKRTATLSRSDYQWRHEPILYGWKPGARHRWYGGRKQTTVTELGPAVVEHDDGSWSVAVDGRVLRFAGADLEVSEVETSVQWYDKPSRSELHPTTKPVALVERHVLNSSRVGDLVLDLFGGSGTTLVACELTRRAARLVELDPKFCDVICTRFQQLTGVLPIAEATGREHDFVAS